MNPSQVLPLALLIGVVAGLRTFTAPATVTWGLHMNWLSIRSSRLAFMGSTAAVIILSLFALGELIADKLPTTPNRTRPAGLIGRAILGGVSGAILAIAGSQSLVLGALLGAIGAISAAFAGFQVRTRLVKLLKCPDFVVAILEDALAISGGLFIVSRF
jgi:uncharacterized membrane protein